MKQKIIILLLVGIALTMATLFWGRSAAVPSMPVSALSIHTQHGIFEFKVEVADTEEARSKGLMFRESLPKKTGMLFLFDEVRRSGMWMKNTLIPLDMFFIDATGIIVQIEQRTEPESLRPIIAELPVKAVLELAGGAANHYNIQPGDSIAHTAFGNANER